MNPVPTSFTVGRARRRRSERRQHLSRVSASHGGLYSSFCVSVPPTIGKAWPSQAIESGQLPECLHRPQRDRIVHGCVLGGA